MISDYQKNKILQVVNVFETGVPAGKYDSVTRLYDGPGKIRQITYGRSQTTEYGNLKRLIEKYVESNGSLSKAFIPYLDLIGKNPLVDDTVFIGFLRDAGRNDFAMRKCQDDFFDLYYYLPAKNWSDGFGFTEALSLLVIYDSFIHSGQMRKELRQLFPETPPSKGGREKVWIEEYVHVRHNWLKNHSLKVLNNTIYRTQCFKDQIAANNWDLSQPVTANGTLVL